MMVNKTDTVRRLIVNRDYKRALSLAKVFRLGITKEASSKMALAYECIVHTKFYNQIGIDTAKAITEGIQILQSLYGPSEDSS